MPVTGSLSLGGRRCQLPSHLPPAYPHHPPLVFLQKVLSTFTHLHLILLPPPHHCSTHQSLYSTAPPAFPATALYWAHSTPPLNYRLPCIPQVCQCVRDRADHPQSALSGQNEGAAFTVVDRKKKRKVSTERSESKQQAQRGTGVNIDCRWAAPGIAKLWVSFPKQGVAMTTISQRITRIIAELKLPEITIERRRYRNGYTTPYEIYGS